MSSTRLETFVFWELSLVLSCNVKLVGRNAAGSRGEILSTTEKMWELMQGSAHNNPVIIGDCCQLMDKSSTISHQSRQSAIKCAGWVGRC